MVFGALLMKWFKLFQLDKKMAVLYPYFVFFLLRGLAIQPKKAFVRTQNP